VLFRSAVVGIIAAIALGAMAFALAPLFDAVGVYISPAGLLAPVIGQLIPSKVVDRLVPGDGAPAGVLFILVCTILFLGHCLRSDSFCVGFSKTQSCYRENYDTQILISS